MNKLLTRIAITSLCLVPSIASAAVPFGCYEAWMIPQQRKYAPQGWFLGGAFGLNKPFSWKSGPEIDYQNSDSVIELTNMSVSPNTGLIAAFLWGYRYHGFRFESDFTIRRSQIGKISKIPKIDPTSGPPVADRTVQMEPIPAAFDIIQLRLADEGVVSNYSFMLNVLYDWYFPGSCLYPFIGLGAGVTISTFNADIKQVQDPDTTISSLAGPAIDEYYLNWGVQVTVGLGYVISDNWDVDIAYKYFMGRNNNYTVKDNNFNITNNTNVEVDYSFKYNANSIVLEFRWS